MAKEKKKAATEGKSAKSVADKVTDLVKRGYAVHLVPLQNEKVDKVHCRLVAESVYSFAARGNDVDEALTAAIKAAQA